MASVIRTTSWLQWCTTGGAADGWTGPFRVQIIIENSASKVKMWAPEVSLERMNS